MPATPGAQGAVHRPLPFPPTVIIKHAATQTKRLCFPKKTKLSWNIILCTYWKPQAWNSQAAEKGEKKITRWRTFWFHCSKGKVNIANKYDPLRGELCSRAQGHSPELGCYHWVACCKRKTKLWHLRELYHFHHAMADNGHVRLLPSQSRSNPNPGRTARWLLLLSSGRVNYDSLWFTQQVPRAGCSGRQGQRDTSLLSRSSQSRDKERQIQRRG